MTALDHAKEELYGAYNQTEHADRLVRIAQHEIDGGRIAEAIATLGRALEAADSATYRIRWTIEKLQKLSEEGPRG